MEKEKNKPELVVWNKENEFIGAFTLTSDNKWVIKK